MLKLYGHPISSFTWKVLIALYENEASFTAITIDQDTYADFLARWPLGKFPILVDEARGTLMTESTVIIEYLDAHYPGAIRFIPADIDTALAVRRWDRIFDHLNVTMSKIVTDTLRPLAQRDAYGVDEARRGIEAIYSVVETQLAGKRYVSGDAFTLADCAAAPALWYAARNVQFGAERPRIAAYLARLCERPSFARALRESEPLFHLYPGA